MVYFVDKYFKQIIPSLITDEYTLYERNTKIHQENYNILQSQTVLIIIP